MAMTEIEIKNGGDLDFTIGCGESKKQVDSRYKKNQPGFVIGWGKREDYINHDIRILT